MLVTGQQSPRRDSAAMRETTVAIKGIKDGLLVTISPAEEWGIILGDLASRIDQQAAFYAGARVTLDVGERPVRKDEMSSLKALLERRSITLWAVSSASRTTLDAAIALDLRTSNAGQSQKPAPDGSAKPAPAPE